LRVQGGWLIMGMAMLGAAIAGGREARAALTGITITGGFQPESSDPPYDYIFRVYLNPGATIHKGDLIQIGTATSGYIDDLVGVNKHSLHSEIGEVKGAKWELKKIKVVEKGFPYASDVTWEYSGKTLTNGTGIEELIGILEIETVVNFDDSTEQRTFSHYVTAGTPIDYEVNKVSGGRILLQDLVVPEPSSSRIVLVAVATAGIAVLVGGRRGGRARVA